MYYAGFFGLSRAQALAKCSPTQSSALAAKVSYKDDLNAYYTCVFNAGVNGLSPAQMVAKCYPLKPKELEAQGGSPKMVPAKFEAGETDSSK